MAETTIKPPKGFVLDQPIAPPKGFVLDQPRAFVPNPDEEIAVAEDVYKKATELELSIDDVQDNYPSFIAGPEESKVSQLFQKYIRDPLADHLGLFQHDIGFRQQGVPEGLRWDRAGKAIAELPAAALHITSERISGLSLSSADVLAQEFDRYILDSEKPVATLAELVAKITHLQTTGKTKQAAEMTGQLFKFMGGLKTARKILGPLINRLPVRQSLKFMFGGGVVFTTESLSEEVSRKITLGEDIDWEKVHKAAGWGVIFGGAESLGGKIAQFRTAKALIKVDSRWNKIPKSLITKAIEAGNARSSGMSKKAWMKVYGKDMENFTRQVRTIFDPPPAEAITKPAITGKVAKPTPKPSQPAPVAKPPVKAKIVPPKPTGVIKKPTELIPAPMGRIRAEKNASGKYEVKMGRNAPDNPFNNEIFTGEFTTAQIARKSYEAWFLQQQAQPPTEAKPTVAEKKEILKKAAPPIGGARKGFVDLTPLADAGQQARSIGEKATKLTTRFTGLDKPVQKSLIEYEEQIKELPQIAADISKESGLVDLTEEQERLLEDFIEQGEKFPEKFPEGLPPELQEAHAVVTAGIENARKRLQDLGVSADWPKGQIKFLKEKLANMQEVEKPDEAGIKTIKQSIDDLNGLKYIHHAYSDTPNKGIKRFFGKKKITKKPIGLLGRKFPTLESAEKAGFTRAPLAVSYADMWHKVMRAEQADALIKTINENPNLSAWSEVAPDDWVTVPEDIFPSSRSHSTFIEGGKIKHRTRTRKYPAPVADALIELTYTRGTHALEQAYDNFNLTMKLVGFYNPIVMGKNDAVQAWRAGGYKGIISMPKALKTFLDKGETYHKLRKGGLFNNVVNYGPSVEVITQNMIDKIRLSSGERAAKKAGEWLNPKNLLTDLKKLQNNTTWKLDEVIRISLWHAVNDSKMLEGLSEFEKIEWVNDAMVNYGKFPKETKRWATKAVYVPTYRIGNFRFFWDQLAKHPWKFKGPILRTLGYKAFVQWGMPALVASIIAFKTKRRFDEVKEDVFVERGYRLVIHNPETNADTVYALSDPLLEGQKLTQREFRRTLELNMAAAPAFILRVLQGRKRTATEDPLGEFFKLGTPIYRDIVTAKSKDKNRVQKLLTHLAIAFTYKRQGRPQDKVNMYEQTAKTLSVWTDWQAQKADLKAMWTGKAFFYGPGGKFGRLVREFEADRKIKIAKTDKEIDNALAAGKNKEAVKIAIEDKRYKSVGGLSDRFLRWQQPLVYLDKTMPKDDKRAFVKWLRENKKMSDKELAKLAEAVK